MIEELKDDFLTIPVLIDDVKRLEDFKMTRVNYLAVETDDPQDDLSITFGEHEMPVIIFGLSAAIHQPVSKKTTFDSIEELENLFDFFEKKMKFSIETPDLWIPNHQFRTENIIKPGDVFRIHQKLFSISLLFSSGRLDQDSFLNLSSDMKEMADYSELETKAFSDWNLLQIEIAKKSYAERAQQGVFMEYK